MIGPITPPAFTWTELHRVALPKALSHLGPIFTAAHAEYERILRSGKISDLYAMTENLADPDDVGVRRAYKSGLVDARNIGRAYYEALMALPPGRRCPFCGVREVEELDHFLPKAKNPSFSLTPSNLIASCHRCNTSKNAKVGIGSETLHPYFDDFRMLDWLSVELSTGPGVVVRYVIDVGGGVSPSDRRRIHNHFDLHDLSKTLSFAITSYVSELAASFEAMPDLLPQEVQEHLVELASSRHVANEPWKVAALRAFASSRYFCSLSWIADL